MSTSSQPKSAAHPSPSGTRRRDLGFQAPLALAALALALLPAAALAASISVEGDAVVLGRTESAKVLLQVGEPPTTASPRTSPPRLRPMSRPRDEIGGDGARHEYFLAAHPPDRHRAVGRHDRSGGRRRLEDGGQSPIGCAHGERSSPERVSGHERNIGKAGRRLDRDRVPARAVHSSRPRSRARGGGRGRCEAALSPLSRVGAISRQYAHELPGPLGRQRGP
jgi:hypothetical protein